MPDFVAGIRACANMRFRPHHIGRQRRPFKGLLDFSVCANFDAKNGVYARNSCELRIIRLCFAQVNFFAKTFKKLWIYRDFCGIVCANERRFLWQLKNY